MKKSSLFGLCSCLPKCVGMLVFVGLSQACTQSQVYAPWVTEDDISEVNGIDGAPSLAEFRGAEAPLMEDVSVPPYPESRLFRVEPETTVTQGPFHDVCPQMRGLILVTHDSSEEVAHWYDDQLETPIEFKPNPSKTVFLWGRYAGHDWTSNYESTFVVESPHISVYEAEKSKIGIMVAPFRTVIDVMYCE